VQSNDGQALHFSSVVLAKLLVALWSEACEVAVVAVACGARRAVAAATLLRGEALGTVRQQARASLAPHPSQKNARLPCTLALPHSPQNAIVPTTKIDECSSCFLIDQSNHLS